LRATVALWNAVPAPSSPIKISVVHATDHPATIAPDAALPRRRAHRAALGDRMDMTPRQRNPGCRQALFHRTTQGTQNALNEIEMAVTKQFPLKLRKHSPTLMNK